MQILTFREGNVAKVLLYQPPSPTPSSFLALGCILAIVSLNVDKWENASMFFFFLFVFFGNLIDDLFMERQNVSVSLNVGEIVTIMVMNYSKCVFWTRSLTV